MYIISPGAMKRSSLQKCEYVYSKISYRVGSNGVDLTNHFVQVGSLYFVSCTIFLLYTILFGAIKRSNLQKEWVHLFQKNLMSSTELIED